MFDSAPSRPETVVASFTSRIHFRFQNISEVLRHLRVLCVWLQGRQIDLVRLLIGTVCWVLGAGEASCVSAKGTVIIPCSPGAPAVPRRALAAPCKSSLTFTTAPRSCACNTVPCGFQKAFVTARLSRKNCLLQGPVKYLLPTRRDRLASEQGEAAFLFAPTHKLFFLQMLLIVFPFSAHP